MVMATMANKKKQTIFNVCGLCRTIQAYLSQFSLISTDWLCLLVIRMPTHRDLAIFVVTTDRQTDRLLYIRVG